MRFKTMPKKAKNRESKSKRKWSYENDSGRYEEKHPDDNKEYKTKKFLSDSINVINESQKWNNCEYKEYFNE